jgi:hypothetical protein
MFLKNVITIRLTMRVPLQFRTCLKNAIMYAWQRPWPTCRRIGGVVYSYGQNCPCSFHLSRFTDMQGPYVRSFFNLSPLLLIRPTPLLPCSTTRARPPRRRWSRDRRKYCHICPWAARPSIRVPRPQRSCRESAALDCWIWKRGCKCNQALSGFWWIKWQLD